MLGAKLSFFLAIEQLSLESLTVPDMLHTVDAYTLVYMKWLNKLN